MLVIWIPGAMFWETVLPGKSTMDLREKEMRKNEQRTRSLRRDGTLRGSETDQRPTTMGPDMIWSEQVGGRKQENGRATFSECTLKFSFLPTNAMTAIKSQLVVFDFDW